MYFFANSAILLPVSTHQIDRKQKRVCNQQMWIAYVRNIIFDYIKTTLCPMFLSQFAMENCVSNSF